MPVPARTWLAIGAATVGMTWMFAFGGGAAVGGAHALGMLIAFAVPMAAAINLVTLNKVRARIDLVPAVLIGGALASAAMLPFALPLQAGARDIALLALLGFFQLGLPCMLMVRTTRHLSAPEVALLALLEVLLGPLWAWLGAGEVPAKATLTGGALVLGALVANELAGLRRPPARSAYGEDAASPLPPRGQPLGPLPGEARPTPPGDCSALRR
jgi:drug/metabolite transporter (DMT)-like permease